MFSISEEIQAMKVKLASKWGVEVEQISIKVEGNVATLFCPGFIDEEYEAETPEEALREVYEAVRLYEI